MRLTTDITAYYKMDTSWSCDDATGNWNDGTINWATYTSSWKINWCYSFDWSNDYIQVDSALWLTARPLTMNAWVKFTDTGNMRVLDLADKDNADNFISLATYDTHAYLYFRNSSGSSTDIWGEVINDWNWHMITWVYDTDTLYLYVDWALDNSWSETKSRPSVDRLSIGRAWDSTPWNYFNWTIDEAWIRSRALSSSEVSDLYNSWDWLQYPFSASTVMDDAIFFWANF